MPEAEEGADPDGADELIARRRRVRRSGRIG
jgi:hypothetical protein